MTLKCRISLRLLYRYQIHRSKLDETGGVLEDGVVEPDLQPVLAERRRVLGHYVLLTRSIAQTRCTSVRVPYAKAVVMLRRYIRVCSYLFSSSRELAHLCRQKGTLHACTERGLRPLISIKMGRVEDVDRSAVGAPLEILICCHIIMYKHRKAQVEERLLQLMQRGTRRIRLGRRSMLWLGESIGYGRFRVNHGGHGRLRRSGQELAHDLEAEAMFKIECGGKERLWHAGGVVYIFRNYLGNSRRLGWWS